MSNAPPPRPAPPPPVLGDDHGLFSLYAGAKGAVILDGDGEIQALPHGDVARVIKDSPVLVCHAPFTRQRLKYEGLNTLDLLELFAFVHPATFCVPTPVGLCRALGLSPPMDVEDYPLSLFSAMRALLSDIKKDVWRQKADPLKIAGVMGQNGKGWPWTSFIFAALGERYDPKADIFSKTDLNIWRHLDEWAETAPPPPPSFHPIGRNETKQRLQTILKESMADTAEPREKQEEYAMAAATLFDPVEEEGRIQAVLLEAGTGIGKTLGYLTPATLWARQNGTGVWVSTYTKNLQRQIHQELNRLYPDTAVMEHKVAVRKGRENYLCLLNLEEMAAGATLARSPKTVIAAGLMARWAAATRDGDLAGGDFPGWLSGLLGIGQTLALADRRGECVYTACDHYHRCFVEKSIRKARHAELVVANHAVVMNLAATAGKGDDLPRHYIFDEGHHLFDAADSAFGAHLTALETYDMRRWIRGHEGGTKTRQRGLKRRIEDLVAGDSSLENALQAVMDQSRSLTAEGWAQRLKDRAPKGSCEVFLHALSEQVYTRADGRDGPYGLETPAHPPTLAVITAAKTLRDDLAALEKPLLVLANGLRKKLVDQSETLGGDDRRRLEAITAGLMQRAQTLGAWAAMLLTILDKPLDGAAAHQTPFVDWMEIERNDGRAVDLGFYRHYIDPMQAFAAAIKPHAHGVMVTSATLRDTSGDDERDWRIAREISGLAALSDDVMQEKFESPFDYPARTKVLIINDVRKDDMEQVAAAFRVLFEAAGGGALGIFTAITRLRAVYDKIAHRLEERGLPLYAQHVDAMDNGTLVDIFRDDSQACLLGTDAVRDGVDIPGDSLRLLVFDRVPWPRPTILHRARRDLFGAKEYDDRITRLKIKQAFGRLIRRRGDRGIFVMLDPMLPSRLYGAFPAGVQIEKIGLADAVASIGDFFKKA